MYIQQGYLVCKQLVCKVDNQVFLYINFASHITNKVDIEEETRPFYRHYTLIRISCKKAPREKILAQTLPSIQCTVDV